MSNFVFIVPSYSYRYRTLTRKLNQSEMTEEEYNKQTQYYQNIYEEKMKFIYNELKLLGV